MIKSYDDYKEAIRKTAYRDIVTLKNESPKTYEVYKERYNREHLKATNPGEYMKKYGI